MIVTISGDAGAGKSTCAKGIAKLLSLTHYSSGDLMRDMAEQKGITLEELCKIAENDSKIDHELDQRQISLGKKEDDFIIDGRLSAFFIPQAIKVFLQAPIEERAKRIFNEKRMIESSSSIEDMVALIKKRRESEVKRYLSWYKYNPYDMKSYDIVYDTYEKDINLMIEEVKSFILDFH